MRDLVLTLLAIAIGVVLGLMSIEPIARAIPHDLARLRVLRAAIDDDQRPERAVILGNSVSMTALDAAQLQVETGQSFLHLGSVGQTLAETVLLERRLGPQIGTVLVFLNPLELERPGGVLAVSSFEMGALFGLYDDKAHIELLRPYLGEDELVALDRQEVRRLFEARWVTRQLVDGNVRRRLRTDLEHDRSVRDLKFPSLFLERAPAWKAQLEIDRLIKRERAFGPGFVPDLNKAGLLALFAEHARARGHLVVVIEPTHPALVAHYGEAYLDEVAAWARGLQAQVIDASRLLAAEDYVDHAHPTREGAAKLTAAIARELAR